MVTLAPCAGQRRLIQSLGLPLTIRVRFVRVRLSTGEGEVLVTSLLDETADPTADCFLCHVQSAADQKFPRPPFQSEERNAYAVGRGWLS